MRGGMRVSVLEKRALLQDLEGEKSIILCASTAAAAVASSSKRRKGAEEKGKLRPEPRSVLEPRRSPSPPSSSTSTLSSSLVGGGGPACSDGSAAASASAEEGARREEGADERLPVLDAVAPEEECSLGDVDDWEALLAEPTASICQDQTFLRWIAGEVDANSAVGNDCSRLPFDPAFALEGASVSVEAMNSSQSASFLSAGGLESEFSGLGSGNTSVGPCLAPPSSEVVLQESMDEKPFLLGPNILLAQQHLAQPPQPSSSFFLPLHHFASEHGGQRPQHLAPPPSPHASELFLGRNLPQQIGCSQLNAFAFQTQPPAPAKPKLSSEDEAIAAAAQLQQALVDQLFKAAELIEAGNTVSARGILARLNHQLPSPVGKPLMRSAFYFKEALHLLASTPPHPPTPFTAPISTPLDVMLKLGSYKTFSDVSPVVQFTSFTCVQALLEELDGAKSIHIIDFDIGVGVQWSAFLQELAQRCSSAMAAVPPLKITACASPCFHHPLELQLIHQNLCHFADSLSIPLEFNVLTLDSFDPALLLGMRSAVGEAIAVNLPVGSAVRPPIPTLLLLVKQLAPKIVISVDHGCARIDLPFAHHVLHTFQSCTVLLDSIDAAGTNEDAANKIERFLVQPRIEDAVMGRHQLSDKILPWRTLFASAGFLPLHFSNFTETQAECLLKRVLVRGFHVEKRNASLSLCWQRRELVSVSAWKC